MDAATRYVAAHPGAVLAAAAALAALVVYLLYYIYATRACGAPDDAAPLEKKPHAGKKKKEVELKVKMQNGLTYAIQISSPIVAMICIKHNYTKRDPFDLLAERVGLAKNDIDNSFKNL